MEAYCSDLGQTGEMTGYSLLDYLLKVSEGSILSCSGTISDPKVDAVPVWCLELSSDPRVVVVLV